jgi:hypothetical protein
VKRGLTWTKAFLECSRDAHKLLEIRAVIKLENMGYKVIWRYDDLPKEIKKYGEPDLVAVKDGEIIILEVKTSDQLRRYSKAAKELDSKLVLVFDVYGGENTEVWGLSDLGIEDTAD